MTSPGAMHDLMEEIERLSRAPILLVASDFDGTIAPLVADPTTAEADRESLVALKNLATMPQTHVAIISGRALADLAARAAEAAEAHLVGSHGSEFEPGFTTPLAREDLDRLHRVDQALQAIIGDQPGFLIERKPASLAFHYRNADPQTAAHVLAQIAAGPASLPGIKVRRGKMVVELSVITTDKGDALQRIRQRTGASAVLFMGDDTTDEDAFATLTGPDVSVKVGEGQSLARFRLSDTVDVARVLATLCERRREWLAGAEAVPIERMSLLSDQRTTALVTPDGRVAWMCLPRIDSAAMFAELLGGPTAGFFQIAPVVSNLRCVRQSYVGDSFVLRTEWPGWSVIDYLDCTNGRPYQRAGRTDLIRVMDGTGTVRITFAPRINFGRSETRLRVVERGLVVEGSLDALVLVSPGVNWTIQSEGPHETAIAEVALSGSPLVLEMRYGTGNLGPAQLPEPQRRSVTERFWSSWAANLRLPALHTELVKRSALVIKALTYGPTGAIAAAATTSLPEHAGGVRNWDYRYCWPRDAAMAAASLVRLGVIGPAMKFLDWVLGMLDHDDGCSMIRPVYTVTGGHLGTESEVAELAGYCGSRPVRVGNAAAHQVQLDVFGPISELIALLADRDAALSSEHSRLLDRMIEMVDQRWQEPDHGIWEVRTRRRQHVHSRVMCWKAVDAAIRVAHYLNLSRPRWTTLRDEIFREISDYAWNDELGAYSAAYDEPLIDAASLCIGLSNCISPRDERFTHTVARVRKDLQDGPVVRRYHYDDGLPGLEGGFLLCTAWLIEALDATGRGEEARALLDEYVKLAGPTGLFAEQYDPFDRRSLGNFPQVYSHVGLIDAACRLGKPGNEG
jgi:trehalose 6-phosphate phosphatase